MAIPVIYLAVSWDAIPETIATHFDINGEADAYGSKNTLFYLLALLLIPTFLIFKLIPIIDPKNKINSMGNSFEKIQIATMGFLSAIATFIVHIAVSGDNSPNNILYAIMGISFMVLGNYFPTIKPNYFLGIRTPWTLENETVWRKTHRFGGRIYCLLYTSPSPRD